MRASVRAKACTALLVLVLAVCTGSGPLQRWGLPHACGVSAAPVSSGADAASRRDASVGGANGGGGGGAGGGHGVGEAGEDEEEPEDFELLPDEELAREWSADDGVALSEKVKALRASLSAASVVVAVKLVGMQPSVAGDYGVDADTLRRHLDALKGQLEQLHVLEAAADGAGADDDDDGTRSPSHNLLVKREFSFVVSHASKSLADRVVAVVQQQVVEGQRHLVDAEAMEAVLASDHRSSALPYTLYVINPSNAARGAEGRNGTGTGTGTGRQASSPSRPLPAYWYRSSYFSDDTCAAPVWQSVLHRLAWVDVAAGEASWGPRTSGPGAVTAASVPRLRQRFGGPHGSRAESLVPPALFVSRLAAFLRTSAVRLVAPPAAHHPFPTTYRRSIHVRVVALTDDEPPTPAAGTGDSNARSASSGDVDVPLPQLHFNDHDMGQWSSLMAPLQHVGRVTGQQVSVSVARLPVAQCVQCMVALAAATRGFTSHLMGAGMTTTVHEYLDSAVLADALRPLADAVVATRGSGGRGADLVVPVFVVERGMVAGGDGAGAGELEAVFLDRHAAAVPVPPRKAGGRSGSGSGSGVREWEAGMVLAVQTRAPKVVVDFECNGNGRTVDPSDPRRAVLASLLQVVWNVAPGHQVWDTVRERGSVDYLWSTGATPFGPFSSSLHLSFALVDAAARHMVLGAVHDLSSQVAQLLEHFAAVDVGLDEALDPAEHTAFLRRWNFFRYKWMRVATFVHLHNFDAALEYVSSMQQDSHALHELVHKAGARLRTRVTCAVLHAAGPGAHAPAPPVPVPATPTPATAATTDAAPQAQPTPVPPATQTQPPAEAEAPPDGALPEDGSLAAPPSDGAAALSWGSWLFVLLCRLLLGGLGFAAATFAIAMSMNDARGGGGRRGVVSQVALWLRVRLARLRLRLQRVV